MHLASLCDARLTGLALLWLTSAAFAQADVPAPSARSEADDAADAAGDSTDSQADHTPAYALGAYVEAFYQWNFGRPSNQITNYRGFDNRHDTFTLSNVAVDLRWNAARVVGRLTLQIGHTPSTYYGSEPERAGAPGANATGPELWKYLQQANAGYRLEQSFSDVMLLSAGLFLSPIGPESIVVHDNWSWSHSNLFFGLPYYHTGARAYALHGSWGLTLAVYNGWNSVVDNNAEKSLSTQLTYSVPERIELSVLYFGGVERATGAPEGQRWRHLFDAHASWYATPRWSLRAHANTGFEPTRFGSAGWVAAALHARVKLMSWLFATARGDVFYEHVPQDSRGRAAPIFFPVAWVQSSTATLDCYPQPYVSLRLEYRHDQSAGAMFFGGHVRGEGSSVPFVANRARQDTITAGVTAWF